MFQMPDAGRRPATHQCAQDARATHHAKVEARHGRLFG
jgi:hypothetical protein